MPPTCSPLVSLDFGPRSSRAPLSQSGSDDTESLFYGQNPNASPLSEHAAIIQIPAIDCTRFGRANGRKGKATSNAVATITPLLSDGRTSRSLTFVGHCRGRLLGVGRSTIADKGWSPEWHPSSHRSFESMKHARARRESRRIVVHGNPQEPKCCRHWLFPKPWPAIGAFLGQCARGSSVMIDYPIRTNPLAGVASYAGRAMRWCMLRPTIPAASNMLQAACSYGNLYRGVFKMKPAKDRPRGDGTAE
jgi:hypothetical protein